jgi:hypothetical protein
MYMMLSCHQNAGQNQDIKIVNRFFENESVQIFGNGSNKPKFDSKKILSSGNACYHLVQSLLSSRLLSKI